MITRGKLAKTTGCSGETIRYFERIGLLPEPERSPAGYRLYNEDHLRRLRFILKARELGFSPQRVRELLRISYGTDDHTRSEVKAVTESHIQEITERIRDLNKLKKRLTEISSHCDGARESSRDCPILISLFGD